jgi:hypothetical protein
VWRQGLAAAVEGPIDMRASLRRSVTQERHRLRHRLQNGQLNCVRAESRGSTCMARRDRRLPTWECNDGKKLEVARQRMAS